MSLSRRAVFHPYTVEVAGVVLSRHSTGDQASDEARRVLATLPAGSRVKVYVSGALILSLPETKAR